MSGLLPMQAEKVETVRRSIIEGMERRKTQDVDGLDMADCFGGLPVTVNARMATNDKGIVFVRHFFYLRGKRTPLKTIIAIAEKLEQEQGTVARLRACSPEPRGARST